jgi:hypothetical protein
LPSTFYTFRPSYTHWLNHPRDIWELTHNLNLLIVPFPHILLLPQPQCTLSCGQVPFSCFSSVEFGLPDTGSTKFQNVWRSWVRASQTYLLV